MCYGVSMMTDVGEQPSTPHKCSKGNPPHTWEVAKDDAGKERKSTPAETKAEKAAEAQAYRDKAEEKKAKAASYKQPEPDCKEELTSARGAEFEGKSIAENEKRKPIESTAVHYKCTKCPEEQEVDIVFEDGQIGESQSETARNYDTDKRKSQQAKRLADIQRQINAERGTTHKPMAKFDKNNVGDEALANKSATRRGLSPEMVG